LSNQDKNQLNKELNILVNEILLVKIPTEEDDLNLDNFAKFLESTQ